jgi:preprotein translocase subunit Sec61beta
MSRKESGMMPHSTAGLIRYFDDTKEAVKIKPEHVIIACGVFILIEIMLKFM